MRPEPNHSLDKYRLNPPGMETAPGSNQGLFRLGMLRIISSGTDPDGLGWEHVSVSLRDRPPSWYEMCRVKELFWSDDETVIQFHPRMSEYVNIHPNVLHLWRKSGVEPELPPSILV